MAVKQHSNGKWYCRFQLNGKRQHLLCTGAKNKNEAEQIENAFKYKLQQQQNGVIPQNDNGVTLNKVFNNFLAYSEHNKKSYKQDRSRVRILKEYFKIRYAKDVKPSDIEKLKSYLLNKGLSKVTINRYLEIISKSFNMAIDNELINKNPLKKILNFYSKTMLYAIISRRGTKTYGNSFRASI